MKKYYLKLTVFIFFIFALLCLCINSVYSKTGLEWGADGDDYYENGNYEKAIGCYKEALKEYPDSANLYYNIGNCYLKLKKYDKAIEYYEICLDKNPSHELAPGKIKEAKRLKESESVSSGDYIKPEMVYIQGGVFQMGSNSGGDNEKPVHSVEVSSFYMGKYEVTNKEYKKYNLGHSGERSNDNYPVESVTWYDAVGYCNWLSDSEGLSCCYSGSGDNIVMDMSKNGYRLPTEAEWEYACRGGTTTNYYWGNRMDGSYFWYGDNSGGQVNTVGQKKPNNFGLYDMSGNVWEWCWDWYGKTYYSSSPYSNPTGTSSGSSRVIRGGSWYGVAALCRSASRLFGTPGGCGNGGGFRVVRSVP